MFDVADDAECAFIGEVIRIYRLPTERPLAVLQVENSVFILKISRFRISAWAIRLRALEPRVRNLEIISTILLLLAPFSLTA